VYGIEVNLKSLDKVGLLPMNDTAVLRTIFHNELTPYDPTIMDVRFLSHLSRQHL
jgi:hypothetical protein